MEQYYLAVDIGASSGRHILGHIKDGKIQIEEIHRFPNGMIKEEGHLVWDVKQLFYEIKTGMKKCVELNKIPVSMGIDTWAVDFVLLGKDDNMIGKSVAYRDHRTQGMDQEVYQYIHEEELYAISGIQKQMFNSIYQLMSIKKQYPDQLEAADKMLLIPDYFHYLLTGVAVSEYTNATTTQLVDPETKEWNWNLIERIGYPKKIFQPIYLPGGKLGELTKEIQQEVGFNCNLILPATHDTASAVMAVPTVEDDVLYISSGTWSLMGTELRKANCSSKSKEYNLTNEGGYDYRFRYLKNIMGLWMIQSVRSEIGNGISYGDLCEQASKEAITARVDCNHERFLAPKSMHKEVQLACRESGQQVPETLAQIAAVVYQSLAQCYGNTIGEIEGITGMKFNKINVIGGGSNASYLNELTARETGKTVHAGPSEATAIGNILAQMISSGALDNLREARKCIQDSFKVDIYQ